MHEPEAEVRLTRRGKAVVALVVLALVLGLPLIGGFLYLRAIGVYGDSEPASKVEVEIPKGSSAEEIGELLAENSVIPSALGFRIAVFLEGGAENIQAGTYALRKGLNARDALDALAEGPVVEFVNITFPEGSWLTDFARIIDEETHVPGDEFLELVAEAKVRSELLPADVETLEGLLFPATYQVIERDTAQTLAKRLVTEMEKRAEAIDFATRAEARGLTPYEAVIVASMVEGEARIDEDRDKIARVIYNRIEEGMRLEIDATVLYALGEHKEQLSESDLAIDSPYNTRLVAGLPPTPIGAPGEASLEASVNPADGPWLYYVLSDCKGHHAFSADYDEFLANKRAYQSLDC
jgi:UPF0755 protein